MIDQYGRTIDYLRLSVTDLCNYRCQYCMPADGVEKGPHGAVLSVEEYGEIARAAVKLGIRKIRLTGGEPLVRRGILDICRTLRAIPELKELCLTTNGSLLPELAKPLQEAGVDRLNISLDTLRTERFREITRRGDLEDAFAGCPGGWRPPIPCREVPGGRFPPGCGDSPSACRPPLPGCGGTLHRTRGSWG